MTNPLRLQPPDYTRLRRADEPSLLGPVPGFMNPTENANVLLNKTIATLNRAGSHPGNPVLAGLGITVQYLLARGEIVTAIHLYQDPGALGVSQLYAAYNFQAGSGLSKAGSPSTGSRKNFVRIVSAGGATEREYWIKSKDADIVTLEGQAALDQATLLPVTIQVQQVAAGHDWLDVRVDFMPSWNDEFQVLHAATAEDREAGFRKSYGGAAFVSFFDTDPGTEGVGVGVNPIDQAYIYDTRKIQVKNEPGIYEITARFRSKADSSFFVDVPIVIEVLEADSCSCATPVDEVCGQMLLKKDTELPNNAQDAASVPGVQDVAGSPGDEIDRDLFYISMHGAIVGPTPTILVRKWQWIADATNLAGAKFQQYGTDLEFLPLTSDAASPNPGGSYGTGKMLTVCFDVAAERALGIAFYTAQIKDGDELGAAQLFTAPKSRDIALMPAGGTGGVDDCITYA